MAIPLLDGCQIASKVVTADALLTQRALAEHLIGRKAHYSFTVKGNQPTLERDIALLFEKRGDPDFVEVAPPDHGRIETRRIWWDPQVLSDHRVDRRDDAQTLLLHPTRLRLFAHDKKLSPRAPGYLRTNLP